MKKGFALGVLFVLSFSSAASNFSGAELISPTFHPDEYSLEDLFTPTEVYQTGRNYDAAWAYAGFIPRMQDPNRIQIVISKKGMTVRASAQFYKSEIRNYANYLVTKAQQMRAVQLGAVPYIWGRQITLGFQTYDATTLQNFYDEVDTRARTVAEIGDPERKFLANLDLLRSYFPDSVHVDARNPDIIHFNIVFPMTPHSSTLSNGGIPRAGTYTFWGFQERRTRYKGGGDVFAGWPFLIFTGAIGLHGPIRYADRNDNLDFMLGDNPDWGIDPSRDPSEISQRWQLIRQPNSHGCIRMEHILTLRHLLPAEDVTPEQTRAWGDNYNSQPLAQQVPVRVVTNPDMFDMNQDGIEDLVGVNYYWYMTNTRNWHTIRNDRQGWFERYYYSQGVNPADHSFFEHSYVPHHNIQIEPTGASGVRTAKDALMHQLNRLPVGYSM